LFHPIDGQKNRRIHRVENLIPLPYKITQDTKEMPLRMRAQIELGLFNQEHEAANVRDEQTLHAHDELESPINDQPMILNKKQNKELDNINNPDTRYQHNKSP